MISGRARTLCGKMSRRSATLSSKGADVGQEHAPSPAAQLRADAYPQSPTTQSWPPLIIYSVASGVIAVVIGAVASLITPWPQRLMSWAAVTGATAVAAGVVRESRFAANCRLACGRLLRRLVRVLPISWTSSS